MHRERETGRDRDMARGRYGERGIETGTMLTEIGTTGGYFDEDRPRRRVKICVEYENGDEYCRYRQ